MRIPAFMIPALVSLLAAGCFQYEETIRLNADGSGSVSARLRIPTETRDLLIVDGDSTRYEALLRRLSKRNIDDRIRRDGVTFDAIRSYDTDSGYVAEVVYRFSDLEAFRRTRNDGRDVSLLEIEEGLYELQLVFSSPAEEPSPGDAEAQREFTFDATRDSDSLRKALELLHVRYVIHIPTRIVSAPGARFGADSAVFDWSSYQQAAEVAHTRDMRVIFARDGLRWPTFEAVPPDGEGFAPQQDAWDR